jgi:endo-1,4-beta-D-glucanase Y
MKKNFLGVVMLVLLAACGTIDTKINTLDSPNLIKNGDFNEGENDWQVFVNTNKGVTHTKTIDSYGRFCIWVGNSGEVGWDANLYQKGLKLDKGVTYTVSFDVVTSLGKSANFGVKVGAAVEPFTGYTFSPETVTEGGVVQAKTFSFTMAVADTNAQLEFHLGGNPDNQYYCFDNVVVVAKTGAATPTPAPTPNEPTPNEPTPTPEPAPEPPKSGGNAYGGSLAPSQAEADKVIADLYAKWKRERLAYAPNKGLQAGEILLTTNTQFDNGMVSEGIGYGMLLSAYNNDKATFDGIWKFAKRNLNQYGLMPWLYTSSSQVASHSGAINNATDGDLDAALALIVATKRGWSYDQDAKNLISNLLKYCVTDGNVLEMGEANNPKNIVISSYFMPGHMKVFAAFTGEQRWLKVADTNYDILKKALDKPNVVLTPFAMDSNGNTSASFADAFNSDAGRGPFRISTDYAWYGDNRAKALMIDFNTFFESGQAGGLSNICESYDRFGNKIGGWCGTDAGWMAASMAASQLAENDTASRQTAWNEVTTAFTGDYYSSELTQLGVMLVSGRLYNPVK